MTIIAGVDVTRVDTSPLFTPGEVVWDAGNVKAYKYVQYDTGAGAVAAVAGNVAYYYTLDGYKNHQVTSDLSDSVELGAGVLQAVLADTNWGWIQIRGAATLTTALTAGADGDPLTPTGATDGTLDVTALVTDHVCAYAGDISDLEIICFFPE